MPKRSHDKGQRHEKAIVRLLQNAGFAAAKTSRIGYPGPDLSVPLLGADRRVEVKCRGKGFTELYRWLDGADLLIVRRDRNAPLVVIPLAFASEIAKATENSRITRAIGAPGASLPAIQENCEMGNDNQEPKIENPPIPADDGFGDSDDNDRLLQGTRAICVDGKWTKPDGAEIPTAKQFLVLSTAEGLQHWEDGQLVEEIIKRANKPLADVGELNGEIPEDTWEDGINGPRPPWAHVYAAYLLDPTDGSILTFMNSTQGAMVAIRDLRNRVKWMRALRGEKVWPFVTLGRRLVSRKYQKYGPDFVIVDWRNLSPLPAATAARQLENHVKQAELNDAVEDVGRHVDKPIMAEILDDEIPEDDWQPPGEPVQHASEKAHAQKGKAPAARMTTKRGVTKIARSK
jgi:hypothetical protein